MDFHISEPEPYRAWSNTLEKVFKNFQEDSKNKKGWSFAYLSSLGETFNTVLALCLFPVPWVILTAVHLAAWRYDFPTSVEMWMWRVSAIYMIAG